MNVDMIFQKLQVNGIQENEIRYLFVIQHNKVVSPLASWKI